MGKLIYKHVSEEISNGNTKQLFEEVTKEISEGFPLTNFRLKELLK